MSPDSSYTIVVTTLCAIMLGMEVALVAIIRPAYMGPLHSLEIDVAAILGKRALCFSGLVLVTLAAAIKLAFMEHSRTEPYLLFIGLVAIFGYGLCISVDALLRSSWRSGLFGTGLTGSIEGTVLVCLRILSLLIAFWSFLHYAMNPKT